MGEKYQFGATMLGLQHLALSGQRRAIVVKRTLPDSAMDDK